MLTKRAVSQNVELELLQPGDRIKTAGAMPEVQRYLNTLRPDPAYTYALVNAMGYSEYYGTNSNADWYGYCPELDFNGLLHAWPDIGQNLETDRMKGRDWPYGYPSFYGAHVYAHHKNTDPVQLGFGDVQFVYANSHMKRIELLMRIHNEEARKKGHLNIVERIHAGERCDVSMGCFRAGALITLADGTRKPIEDVAIGDEVLTHRGRARRVTEVHKRWYRGTFYEISPGNEQVLHATVEHPFYALPSTAVRHRGMWLEQARQEPDWVHARCLDDHVLTSPRLALGPVVDVPIALARLVGYYLADGHVAYHASGEIAGLELCIARTNPVSTEIHEIHRALELPNAPTFRDHPKAPSAHHIGLYGRKAAELCLRYAGAYAKKKRLDPEVFRWSREAALAMVGAYLNGDGHRGFQGSIECSTASIDLANQLVLLLRCHGISASLQTLHHRPGKKSVVKIDTISYVVHIGAQWAHHLAPYCYKVEPREIQRAKNVIKPYETFWAVPMRSCEAYEGEDWVYNFEVEEDESYVVNGVTAHNCKIPLDACSICTDWDAVHRAWKTFDPLRHKHWGLALLEQHKKRPIRGLAVTAADYCQCLRTTKNQLRPDGRKAFMYNIHPRFFDISCVFIGADRTARVMWHMADAFRDDAPIRSRPSPLRLARLGLEELFGKIASKQAELEKEIPDGYIEKVLTDSDTAPEVRFDLMKQDPQKLLSSAAALGILLSPMEFQRMLGGPARSFPTDTPEVDDGLAVNPRFVDSSLLDALSALAPERSGFKPLLEPRITTISARITVSRPRDLPGTSKVAALYNGYRLSVLEHGEKLAERARGYLIDDPLGFKVAASPLAALLLGVGPVVHLLAAHLRQKEDEGQQLGTMASFIANNPTFVSLAALGAGIRLGMMAEGSGVLSTAAKLLGVGTKA